MSSPSHAGKVAIVTGASRGIGRAVARELAGRGAHVVLVARNEALLREARDEVVSLGARAAICAVDLREASAADAVMQTSLGAFGGIDIVINNAGATKRGDFLSLTDEDWLDGYALKLHGAVRLTRAAWPTLRDRKGSVLNIAGVGGRTPGPEFTIGGSVNAAVVTFTKALADLGVRDGVQVNAINPGYIRTDRFAARLKARAAATGKTEAAIEAAIIAEDGIVRIGEPADVAGLVAYVTSAAGRYLQGAVIDLDGGQTKTV